jgi:hypothetical protein
MRKIFCQIFLLMMVCPGYGLAQVTIPDTPAGHTLQAWLDAFNSDDRARIEAYVKTIDKKASVDGLMSFRSQTGGMDLLSIVSSDPLRIRFRVKDRNTPIIGLGGLTVKDGQPPTVESFMLRALPPGAVVEHVTIDAAERKKVIDGVNAALTEFYVDGAVAQQMADALKAHEAKGDYDAITDGDDFAARLMEDARAVSKDKHLRVDFSPFKMPPREPSPEDDARFHQQMDGMNCGFDKVEILPNNIGYIKFDGFMDASYCGPTVVSTMGFVAHTDAVIFDIRENGGGQPAMVTLIASYLFDKPTHLIDIYNRKENTTTQNWTLSYLPGQRLTKQPVFVLTSKRTFSGAEEFAFDLKNQKRATIVGETTGGGAHPVSGHTVADYFMVGVPFAKSLDPVTKTNWEGTGVEPDVKTSAADALATAEKLALEKIRAKKDSK